MTSDTTKRTLRIPEQVDKALSALAEESDMEALEYMTDVLSHHALESGKLDDGASMQVQKEMEIKEHARTRAREICSRKFDPHVTLKVFLEFREKPELNAAYQTAIGGDPLKRKNPTQARINRTLGSIIKHAVRGEAETTSGGHGFTVNVDAEFIRSYTPLRPRTS